MGSDDLQSFLKEAQTVATLKHEHIISVLGFSIESRTNIPFLVLAYQHYHVPPPSLRSKNPAISPAVEQVVLKALAKDPSQRFSSVQEFATALEYAAQPRQPIPPVQPVPQPQPVRLERAAQTQQQIPQSAPFPQKQPISYVPAQSQPKPPTYLPLVRGKLTKRDVFVIGGYSLLLLLLSVAVFFTDPSPDSGNTSPYWFFWLFAVVSSGPILAGALFGSRRAALTMLIYTVAWIVIGIFFGLALQQPPLTFSLSHLRIGSPDAMQALLIFLGSPLAALAVGLLYELQTSNRWWKSALSILLGSLIIAMSIFLAQLSTRNSTVFIGTITFGFIFAIPAFALERVIYATTVAVMKRRQRTQRASM